MDWINILFISNPSFGGPDHFTRSILFPVLIILARTAVTAAVLYDALPLTASTAADAVTTALLIKPPIAITYTPAAPAHILTKLAAMDRMVNPSANFMAGDRANGDCNFIGSVIGISLFDLMTAATEERIIKV